MMIETNRLFEAPNFDPNGTVYVHAVERGWASGSYVREVMLANEPLRKGTQVRLLNNDNRPISQWSVVGVEGWQQRSERFTEDGDIDRLSGAIAPCWHPDEFTVDASLIGLRPGDWPPSIEAMGHVWIRTAGDEIAKTYVTRATDDVGPFFRKLTIFNN